MSRIIVSADYFYFNATHFCALNGIPMFKFDEFENFPISYSYVDKNSGVESVFLRIEIMASYSKVIYEGLVRQLLKNAPRMVGFKSSYISRTDSEEEIGIKIDNAARNIKQTRSVCEELFKIGEILSENKKLSMSPLIIDLLEGFGIKQPIDRRGHGIIWGSHDLLRCLETRKPWTVKDYLVECETKFAVGVILSEIHFNFLNFLKAQAQAVRDF